MTDIEYDPLRSGPQWFQSITRFTNCMAQQGVRITRSRLVNQLSQLSGGEWPLKVRGASQLIDLWNSWSQGCPHKPCLYVYGSCGCVVVKSAVKQAQIS